MIGVATDAINGSSAISSDDKQTFANQIPVAYAVCYLAGTATAAYCLSTLAPRLLGTRDLAADADELEQKYGIAQEPGLTPAYRRVVRRSYRVLRAGDGDRRPARLNRTTGGSPS